MDYKEIMELTKWLEQSAFTQYSLGLGNHASPNSVHISMSKQSYHEGLMDGMRSQGSSLIFSEVAPRQPAAPAAVAAPAVPPQVEAPKAEAQGHIIRSPIVGTFYESAGPDKPAFAKVGQSVKKGDVLCILEAMKIMNEVCADADGVVAEIFAANGQMVEARMPLFRLEV